MKKSAFISVSMLAVLLFSAPRGAAAFDFNNSAEPLRLEESAQVPAPPAPAQAAPKACKPFLLAIAVGGVSETVVLERACTPENDPVWAIKVERSADRRIFVRVSTEKYPADREKLESRIRGMVVEGINQADADFIVTKTGPALARAAAAVPREKVRILSEATEELKEHLSKP